MAMKEAEAGPRDRGDEVSEHELELDPAPPGYAWHSCDSLGDLFSGLLSGRVRARPPKPPKPQNPATSSPSPAAVSSASSPGGGGGGVRGSTGSTQGPGGSSPTSCGAVVNKAKHGRREQEGPSPTSCGAVRARGPRSPGAEPESRLSLSGSKSSAGKVTSVERGPAAGKGTTTTAKGAEAD